MEYERAARLRDDIGALQRAMEQNAIVFRDGTDADVIALAEDPLEVAVQIFHVRGGRVRGERGWVADRFDESGSEELIEQFLLQLYADTDRPTDPGRVAPGDPGAGAAAVAGVADPDAHRTPRLGRVDPGARSAATSGR